MGVFENDRIPCLIISIPVSRLKSLFGGESPIFRHIQHPRDLSNDFKRFINLQPTKVKSGNQDTVLYDYPLESSVILYPNGHLIWRKQESDPLFTKGTYRPGRMYWIYPGCETRNVAE